MQIVVTQSSSREEALRETLRRASNELISQAPQREALVCRLFGARGLHESSRLMEYGWERASDTEINNVVATLVGRRERISILEVGAGTTWGTEQRNFGVPGLARCIKHALPRQALVSVCDRAQGYDAFFHSRDGSLVHTDYSEDRLPKFLTASPLRSDGSVVPTSPPFLRMSASQEPRLDDWLRWHERTFRVDLLGGGSPIFFRPKLDPEFEARLFGVRVVPASIDYLNLLECLTRAGEHERYDLIFGRHLLPQYFPSRIKHLLRTMPEELSSCARNYYVQFDRCFFGDEDYADLVFRHHEYIPS